MEYVADVLLAAGAIGAGIYCFILSRKLSRLSETETGMGAAVTLLSKQVDDLKAALEVAQTAAKADAESLRALTEEGNRTAQKLELMMAALHDVEGSVPQPRPATEVPSEVTFVRHARQGVAVNS